jgi:drug/metabolite transporter (DMT)-like permease
MVLGSALLSSNDALSKWLARDLAVTQVWCLRGITAMLLILAVAWTLRGQRPLAVKRAGMQALRAALFVGTTACIVTGLSLMPLVNMSAILFSTPLLIAVMSPALLGERLYAYRFAGAAVGFAGVVLILRPGADALQIASGVAVLAALMSALRDIVTRHISQTETALSILFWGNVGVLVVGFAVAATPWVTWQPVSPLDAGLLAVNGALNVAAHFCVVRALRLGEVAAVAPFRYAGLLWAVMLGVVVFGEVPDALTVSGAALVVGSGLYLLRREQRRRALR